MGAAGRFLEIDTAGRPGQDATGIGRLHAAGIPVHATLSCPAAAHPAYTVQRDPEQPAAALAPAWRDDSGLHCIPDLIPGAPAVEVAGAETDSTRVRAGVCYRTASGMTFRDRITLDERGVHIESRCEGGKQRNRMMQQCGYCVPVPVFDGAHRNEVRAEEHRIEVNRPAGGTMRVTAESGRFMIAPLRIVENRNGELALFLAWSMADRLRLRIEMMHSGS